MMIIQARADFGGKREGARRAFTMIEIMISLLILGILLSLLIVSARHVMSFSRGTVDRQTVNSIHTGASQFKQLFGFYVPLIRDQDTTGPSPGTTIVLVPGATPPHNQINIHQPKDPDYLTDMRATGVAIDPTNPLLDHRYSERSIPVYLAGQLSIPLDPAQPNGVPIDGIPGAGFCKPLIDGTFAIPADLLRAAPAGSDPTKRTGATYEPLINLNSNSPKLLVDPPNAPGSAAYNPEHVLVVDRNNVPIRYYRWEHGPQQANGTLPLNVPLMVGRIFNDPAVPALAGFAVPGDRDLSKSANIRSATFAIVAAGADGFFGDEVDDTTLPIGDPRRDAQQRMLAAAGMPAGTTGPELVKARMKVERDNIVEVEK